MAMEGKTEQQIKDRSFLKAITFSYLLATCLLAAAAIGSYAVLQEYTKSEATTAAQINVSGRQRMLSQKIAVFGNRLVEFSEHSYQSDMVEVARRDLLAAVDRLQQSHQSLIHGDPAMNLPGQLTDKVRAIYFDGSESLGMQIKAFAARALALASVPKSELTHDNENLLYINSAVEGGLLATLDTLVKEYQRDSEENIARLQYLQHGLMGASLVILLLLVLFVFRPMVQRIRCKIAALRDTETRLRLEMLEHQKSEQKFFSVVESSPVAMLGANADGCIVLCNRQAEQLFGYTNEELTGMQIEMLLPKEFRNSHRQYRADYAAESSTRPIGIGRKLFGLHRDGHEFPAEIGISAA